jgi:hypothetical protein
MKTNGNSEITIHQPSEEIMQVEYSRMAKSRLVWIAPGLNVYVLGSIADKFKFEQASNMALQECINRHIPASSLRYQRNCGCSGRSSTDVNMYKKGLF